MHYCPKCQQTYEDDAQRFCLTDGARLLPASNSAKSASRTSGVFTNLIGKPTPISKGDDKFAAIPHFVKTDAAALSLPNFQPREDLNAQNEDDVELELEPIQTPVKPATRIVNPSEVPSGTASIGDRKTNPTGRAALSRKNPRILLGQAVKGRYNLVELLGDDETSISYLAEDKINAPKKVLVRVLMDEDHDEATGRIYAEERVSLSHVNHPNIGRVIDSGELPEGNPFIVSEFVEADSIRDLLKKTGQLNALRAARIVRQAAYALSEVHQNAILHRDLKPENILLTVSETGSEQIKLINFGTSSGRLHKGNLAYKAPEVLEGKTATFAGDIYSLAVVAYQMLTNRLPFQGGIEKDLLRGQRQGLLLKPTNLRLDLPSSVDDVLEKAMAFKPTNRYPKARDFGDAFFNALARTSEPSVEEDREIPQSEKSEILPPVAANPIPAPNVPLLFSNLQNTEIEVLDSDDNETLKSEYNETATVPIENAQSRAAFAANLESVPQTEIKSEEPAKNGEAKSADDLWTRRSPEPPVTASWRWLLLSIVGLAILLAAVWAIWSYSLDRQNEAEIAAQAANEARNQQNNTVSAEPILVPNNSPGTEDIEVPPLPRQISQPPETTFFQNSKQSLKGDLLRNFLPFSLYYPNDWQVNAVEEDNKTDARGKFLDISKNTPDGTPSEQMLVSYYDSTGTYKNDKTKFLQLVKETNETLTKLIPNYQTLSENETIINGWKAYEVKFQGGGTTGNGEKMLVWGRRIFIPASRPGLKSGYSITLLATSLSPDVQSVDEVGVNGELATVLQTFEPGQNF
ncbi:MAG: serine/threonine protein kinase [Pyrinomonadaceae bacterium]